MSMCFTLKEALDGNALPEALRARGVLNLVEEPDRRTIYQRVGKRWSYTPQSRGATRRHVRVLSSSDRGDCLIDPHWKQASTCVWQRTV